MPTNLPPRRRPPIMADLMQRAIEVLEMAIAVLVEARELQRTVKRRRVRRHW